MYFIHAIPENKRLPRPSGTTQKEILSSLQSHINNHQHYTPAQRCHALVALAQVADAIKSPATLSMILHDSRAALSKLRKARLGLTGNHDTLHAMIGLALIRDEVVTRAYDALHTLPLPLKPHISSSKVPKNCL